MTKEQFKQQHTEDRDKPVTTGVLMDVLLEYTDQFLIPAMSNVMDEKIKASEERMTERMTQRMNDKINGLEHNLKTYIDRKLSDYTTDLFKKLDKRYEQDRAFKEKVVDLFKKHRIGSPEEIAYLEGMVQASP